MKTIEDFAIELSNKEVKRDDSYSRGLRVGIEFGVEKGVEFAQRWIPIEEDKPEALKMVLVKCNNKGKIYSTTAQFIPEKTVLASYFLDEDSIDDFSEYDEELDDDYVIQGWWEYQTEVDLNWKISSEVTHWRPINFK